MKWKEGDPGAKGLGPAFPVLSMLRESQGWSRIRKGEWWAVRSDSDSGDKGEVQGPRRGWPSNPGV